MPISKVNKNGKNPKKNEPKKEPRPARRWIPFEYKYTDDRKVDIGRPVDFSFKHYTTLDKSGPEFAGTARLGKIPKSSENKYMSRSLWLNNNSIKDISNIHIMVESILQYPERLAFLDLSFNEIEEIGKSLQSFPNLVVLYLHGNKIAEIKQVYNLRAFKKLHNLTLYGNPLYDNNTLGNMRSVICYILPQLKKLDHNGLVGIERTFPVAGAVSRFVKNGGREPETKKRTHNIRLETAVRKKPEAKQQKPEESTGLPLNDPNRPIVYPHMTTKCFCMPSLKPKAKIIEKTNNEQTQTDE